MRNRTTVTVALAASLAVAGLVLAQEKPGPGGDEKRPAGAHLEALSKLAGTKWSGTSELWLDKLGNEAQTSKCSLTMDAAAVGSFGYTWSFQGKPQSGSFVLRDGQAVWSDTWHQPTPVKLSVLGDSWALIDAHYTFSVGGGPKWGWRIALSQRPKGELVLQMITTAPWGEEKRAVRMVFTRAP